MRLAIFDCCLCCLWTESRSLGWTLQHLNSLVGPAWNSVYRVFSVLRKSFKQRLAERPVHLEAATCMRHADSYDAGKHASISKDVQKELKKETQELRQSTIAKSRKACHSRSSRVVCYLMLGCHSVTFTWGMLHRFMPACSSPHIHACLAAGPAFFQKQGWSRWMGSPTDWINVVIAQNSVVMVSLRVCGGVAVETMLKVNMEELWGAETIWNNLALDANCESPIGRVLECWCVLPWRKTAWMARPLVWPQVCIQPMPSNTLMLNMT